MAEKLGTEIRREQIVKTALALLSKRGFKSLSMAAIARRVGVVPSAIYRHFSGKDALLDALLDFIRQKRRENVQAARAASPIPLERLRVLLGLHVKLMLENNAIPRIIFTQIFSMEREAKKKKVKIIFTEYIGMVAEIVAGGQKNKTIRRDIPAQTIALMFLGIIQPAAVMWRLTGAGFDISAHAKQSWKMFKKAIT